MMNGDEGSGWDIACDLPFLIASDVELQTDLVELCDLMDDSSSSTAAAQEDTSTNKRKRRRKPSAAPAGARNQHQARVRHEILDLQQEVELLRRELDETKETALHTKGVSSSKAMSPWQKMARMQECHASKALRENRRLRAAVDEQGSFIDKMAKLMRKKPRLDAVNEATWCDYKLAAQQSLREIGIHAIADRQYRRKDTVLLNAGLVGREDNFFSFGPLESSDASVVVLQIRSHIKLAAPCAVVSRAIWQVTSGEIPPPLSSRASVTIDRLDEWTVYERFAETNAGGVVSHANTVLKFFVEECDGDDSHVMVWRSVLEDALVPHMSKGAIEDESGWVVITPIDDHSCWQSMVLHNRIGPTCYPTPGASILPLTHAAENATTVDTIAKSLRQLTVEEAPPALGKFLAPTDHAAVDLGLPLHGPFFERGRQIERAIKSAVNSAIDSYQRGLQNV
ncbi:Aste57867_14628 [Aphanomyces stellatus]|uniref:Aste57867_14628 protein n=1 Tax=Aphanomyces stellatus TaxID=120398 RepID=A0A485L1H9_9STRA|nr:hypothetical protein As57867_014573 [Aphanomyces stellatus]VFT91447.1 Aste57867_14628 [Aphanomyces stellatus]